MAKLDFLKTAFPFIHAAASLGGPVAVMAADMVGKALGADKKVDPTPEGIAQAVQDAGFTPEQRAALLQTEAQVQLEMEKLKLGDLETVQKMANDDRASARNMQVQTRSWTAPVIAGTFVVGFFVVVGLKIGHVFAPDQTINDLITTMRDGLMLILAYYFGSSIGSDRKTDLLAAKS